MSGDDSDWLVCPIVGCAASKVPHAAPARHLYTSSLFRMSMQYADAIAKPHGFVFIASAKHGIVRPDEVLEPYEHELLAGDARAWGTCAMTAITRAFARAVLERPAFTGRPIRCRVVLLMGQRYADPIVDGLERMNASARAQKLDDDILPTDEPLRGMQIGERLQWLRRQLDARVN